MVSGHDFDLYKSPDLTKPQPSTPHVNFHRNHLHVSPNRLASWHRCSIGRISCIRHHQWPRWCELEDRLLARPVRQVRPNSQPSNEDDRSDLTQLQARVPRPLGTIHLHLRLHLELAIHCPSNVAAVVLARRPWLLLLLPLLPPPPPTVSHSHLSEHRRPTRLPTPSRATQPP